LPVRSRLLQRGLPLRALSSTLGAATFSTFLTFVVAFVALDTAKLRNAVAIADAGRSGEIRYLGEFDNTEVATRKLVAKLASKHTRLTFCYEAGPTGYGLFRLIKSLGHDCIAVAPSLIPSKPGDLDHRPSHHRRTTPAMTAGITKRLWEIGDIVDVLEAWEQSGCARG
jgi:hypothetical protein